MDYDVLFAHIRGYLDLGSTDYSTMLADLAVGGDLKVLTEAQRSQRQELRNRLRELERTHDGSPSPIDYVRFADANGTEIFVKDERDIPAVLISDEAMFTDFAGAVDNVDEESQSVEVAVEVVDELQIEPPLDESLSLGMAEDSSEFNNSIQYEPPATITGTYQITSVSSGDNRYEKLFKDIAEDLKKTRLIDFNGRRRTLNAIHDPQNNLPATQYQTFLQLRDALYDRRQSVFNHFKSLANEAYLNPERDLDEKIAALDEALNPRWVVEEESDPLRRRRNDLSSQATWSEEKARVFLEYVQHNLNHKKFLSGDEEYEWLRVQHGRLDALLFATINEAIRDEAQLFRRSIETKRDKIAKDRDYRSSRVADRDYVRVIKDAEQRKRNGEKHIEDTLDNVVLEIDTFIGKVEKEYAEYARTEGKDKLSEVLGNDLGLVDALLSLDRRTLEDRAKSLKLNPNQRPENNRASIEIGLVHLLPQQYPHLVQKRNITQDRTINPKAIAFGGDRNAEREFEALTVLLPTLLKLIEQVEKWAEDKSFDSLLNMYAVWQSPELKKELDQKTKGEFEPLDRLWKSFGDEHITGKLWLLYPTQASFEARLNRLDTQFTENPVFKSTVGVDHPYYAELTRHKDKIIAYREHLANLRADYAVILDEKRAITDGLDGIQQQLNGGAPVDAGNIKVQLGEWRNRITGLREEYHYHADDLQKRVTQLETQADTRTSDEQLAKELSDAVVGIYASPQRRDEVGEWETIVQRAAEEDRFSIFPSTMDSDVAVGHAIYLFASARSAYLNAKSTPATEEGYQKQEDWLRNARTALDALKMLLSEMSKLPPALRAKQKLQPGWVTDLEGRTTTLETIAESARRYREQFEAFERERQVYIARLENSRETQFKELASYTRVIIHKINPEQERLHKVDPQAHTALQIYLLGTFAGQWDKVLEPAINQFMNAPLDQSTTIRMARQIREAFTTASKLGIHLEKSLMHLNAFRTRASQMTRERFQKLQAQVDRPFAEPFDLIPLEHWEYEALFDQVNADAEFDLSHETTKRQGQLAAFYLLALIQDIHKGDLAEIPQALAAYIQRIEQRERFDTDHELEGIALSVIEQRQSLYILRDAYLINYADKLQFDLVNGQQPTDEMLNLQDTAFGQANLIRGAAEVVRIGSMWRDRLAVLHDWLDGATTDVIHKIVHFRQTEREKKTPQDAWALRRYTETMRSMAGILNHLAEGGNNEGALEDLDSAAVLQETDRADDARELFVKIVRDNRVPAIELAIYERLKDIIERTLPASLSKAYDETLQLSRQAKTLVHGLTYEVQQRMVTLDLPILERLKTLKERLDNLQKELKTALDQFNAGSEELRRVIRNDAGANAPKGWRTSLVNDRKAQVDLAIGNFYEAATRNWPYDESKLRVPIIQPQVGAEDYTKFIDTLTAFSSKIKEIGSAISSVREKVNKTTITDPVAHYRTLVGEMRTIAQHIDQVNQSFTDYGFNNAKGNLFRIPDVFFETGMLGSIRGIPSLLDEGYDRSEDVRWAAQTAGFDSKEKVQAWGQGKTDIYRLNGFADHALVFALMKYRAEWWKGKLDEFGDKFQAYCGDWKEVQDWIHYTRAVEAKICKTHNSGRDLPNVIEFNPYLLANYESPAKAGTMTMALDSIDAYDRATADLQSTWKSLTEQGDEIPSDFDALRQAAFKRLYESEMGIMLLDHQSSYAAEIGRDFPPQIHKILESPILTNEVNPPMENRRKAVEHLKMILKRFGEYNAALKSSVPEIRGNRNERNAAIGTRYVLRYAMYVLLDNDTPNIPRKED